MNLLPAVLPKVRIWDNPLCVSEDELAPVLEYTPRVGLQMRELIPPECGRAVLIVNGQALMQNEWHREVFMGDVIEWHVVPGSGQTSRTILTIIAVVVIAYFTAGIAATYGAGWGAAFGIVANIAAQILINALVPITPANTGIGSGQSAGSVYNTSLSGNQSRLNQPIPVIYGRMRTFPDFAAQPYAYYQGNDQYYNALLCVGQGEYAIEAINIDDTPIANFSSVYYKILGPGVAPTKVLANIVTAIEVAGNVLDANVPVGGFVVNKPRTLINKLYWDIVAEQGQGVADAGSGDFSTFEIAYSIDIQYVDDFGTPAGSWNSFYTGSVSAATRTPQRWTFEKDLPKTGRVTARFTRTTAKNESNLVVNAITLAGLRGRLTTPAPLCATATHIEISMKANEQLNGLTQKKLAVISRRKIRAWHPDAGWLVHTESRSIAWSIVDKLKSADYGDGLSDSEIDLQSFYDLDQIYQTRQDHLDILFDSRITSKDANRTMGQVGRAVVFQRMGVFTVTRDQFQALPTAAYTTRDIIPGSTSIGYALVTPETADAIDYEYFDNRSWDWTPIRCNLPGVVTAAHPVTLRVNGITGATHALREGTYLAAVNLYRRKFPKWQTEMKGLISAYGSAVIFSPALPTWGHPGDVVAWNSGTRTATLSEPLTWTPGVNHFITLEQPTGALTIAIPATAGGGPNDVVLGLDPGFTPTTDDSDSDRTKFIFGPEGQHQKIVRLVSIVGKGRSQDGNPIIEMSGVAENNLVHTADNPYLPAGGIIQDPVPTTSISDVLIPTPSPGEDPLNALVSFMGENLTAGDNGTNAGTQLYDSAYVGGGFELRLNHDGTAAIGIYKNFYQVTPLNSPSSTDVLLNQWLPTTLEPGDAAKFEASVAVTSYTTDSYVPNGNGAFGASWFNLGSDQAWFFGAGYRDSFITAHNDSETQQPQDSNVLTVRVQIRHIGTKTNLVDKTMSWVVNFI